MARRLPCGIGGRVGTSASSVPIAPAQFSTVAKRNTSVGCGVTGTSSGSGRVDDGGRVWYNTLSQQRKGEQHGMDNDHRDPRHPPRRMRRDATDRHTHTKGQGWISSQSEWRRLCFGWHFPTEVRRLPFVKGKSSFGGIKTKIDVSAYQI